MFVEFLKEKLACQIAEATFDKYQEEIYALTPCKNCYSDIDILSKRILLDLLENYNKQIGCNCNLDKIKDLH